MTRTTCQRALSDGTHLLLCKAYLGAAFDAAVGAWVGYCLVAVSFLRTVAVAKGEVSVTASLKVAAGAAQETEVHDAGSCNSVSMDSPTRDWGSLGFAHAYPICVRYPFSILSARLCSARFWPLHSDRLRLSSTAVR